MPQTGEYSTPELGIQLAWSPSFAPGATIHGTINRAAHIVTPRAIVTISLHGRSKSKITASSGSNRGTNTYRAAFNFFNPAATTQVLFDGPLHVEHGTDHAAWPFALTIPPTVDTRAILASCSPKASYECISSPRQGLPGTFAFSSRTPGLTFEGYVEYYLQATLQIYSTKPGKARFATLPLFVRTPSPDPPIADFLLQAQRYDRRRRRPYKFMSYRLVPGLEDIKPSLLQKVQRLLPWKSVPSLGVEFEVEAPRVIQLEHPSPIPFCIRAIPVWERTSEIIHDVPQLIKLDSVSLKIIAGTNVLGMGSFNRATLVLVIRPFFPAILTSKGESAISPFPPMTRP